MDATFNFTLGVVPASVSKIQTPDRLLSRRTLQRIATRMSLVSEGIGFSILGILIIASRHQAELNGLAGGSVVAMIGGIGAFLVGTVFLVAAGLHWRFCARHPAALEVGRQSVRLTFAGPNPVTANALLSA